MRPVLVFLETAIVAGDRRGQSDKEREGEWVLITITLHTKPFLAYMNNKLIFIIIAITILLTEE
jgi:hypothetical protein